MCCGVHLSTGANKQREEWVLLWGISQAFAIACLWRSLHHFSHSIFLIIGDTGFGLRWECLFMKQMHSKKCYEFSAKNCIFLLCESLIRDETWILLLQRNRAGLLIKPHSLSACALWKKTLTSHTHELVISFQKASITTVLSNCCVTANKCWGVKYWFLSNRKPMTHIGFRAPQTHRTFT